MESTAGEQCSYRFGLCECTGVRAIYFFQMIAACRAEFYGKLCSAGARKLFGVHSWPQAVPLTRFEDLFGLREVECAALAKNIAEFGEFLRGDFWKEVVDQERDV